VNARTRVTAAAGVGSAALGEALVAAAPQHWLKLFGALLLACVASGAAVMCWLDAGEPAAQAGLVLVISIAVFALVAALMIWVSTWYPRAAFGVLALASVISCTLRLAVPTKS
jgi:hypothetical protein